MPAIGSSALTLRPLLVVAALAASMVMLAVALWTYYGSTVFFEILRTGWIACF